MDSDDDDDSDQDESDEDSDVGGLKGIEKKLRATSKNKVKKQSNAKNEK